jgi:hypothetical protein
MKQISKEPSSKVSGQKVFLAGSVVISVVVLLLLIFTGRRGPDGKAEGAVSRLQLEDIPFNGARAYEYLKQIADIGPRRSGSPGMAAQQKLLTQYFEKIGGRVELQQFQGKDPLDGSSVPMANLIVHWHPESKERILLAAHYDTLPFPMNDRKNPRGVFVGANDGASGVALLMELGRDMGKLPAGLGVDFVLFDGEEYIFDERHPFFQGSEYFARKYVENPPPYRYRWGVLLDMVGHSALGIYQDGTSMQWRDVRPLVKDIWGTAERLGVREFIPRTKYVIRDDHLPIHDLAKIPMCDVIDFDYPPWHTQGDTADKCSALSLAKVGWVIEEWLKNAVAEKP